MPAGKITALRAQANDAQRVNVFINGIFALGVSLNTIANENLFVGKEISLEEYTRLELTESGDKAYNAALRLLELRPRSEAELRDRLRRKEFSDDAIGLALTKLQRLGLLDDAAFARFWVENRQATQPRGMGALRNELRNKGIDSKLIETTLDESDMAGSEEQRAMQIARKSLHKYASATDRNSFNRRFGSFLQRRGFSFSIIGPILERLWNETQESQAKPDDARPSSKPERSEAEPIEAYEEAEENDESNNSEFDRTMEIARAALHKYASSPDRNNFNRRFGSYLQRRGLSYQSISPVLAQLWNELHNQEFDPED
jgi:regulatory protein